LNPEFITADRCLDVDAVLRDARKFEASETPVDRSLPFPEPVEAASGSTVTRAYARAALVDECAEVANATEGGRNARLNRAAFSLGQLVAVGLLDEGEVCARLEAAAAQCGLEQREARSTIESGLRAGKKQPREIPERSAQAARAAPAMSLDDLAAKARQRGSELKRRKLGYAEVLDKLVQEARRSGLPEGEARRVIGRELDAGRELAAGMMKEETPHAPDGDIADARVVADGEPLEARGESVRTSSEDVSKPEVAEQGEAPDAAEWPEPTEPPDTSEPTEQPNEDTPENTAETARAKARRRSSKRATSKDPRVANADQGGAPDTAGWRARLTLNDQGAPKSTLANATLVLQHEPAWQGVLGYDEREESPVFLRPPPFADCPPAVLRAPRDINDTDEVRVAQWLEARHRLTIPLAQIHAALKTVASAAPFDRVRDYLDGLEKWDGVPRIDHWLSCLLGATDTEYTRAVGSMWLIAAVARTRAPGCKADHVLVLEGPQGIRKSSALRTLAGDDFFGDDIPPLGGKDSQQYLGPLWIVELGEMEAATKAESNTLKRFLTTTVDRYRPPFGRYTIKHARRCVFAGSVNLEDYLKDPTGGRRFWPVTCTKVNLEMLTAAREQLWAEADYRYRAGEEWHLSPRLEALASEEQAKRLESDPWEDVISAFLPSVTAGFVTTLEVLTRALEVEIGRVNKADKNRVGAVMRHLGWSYVEEGPDRLRGWRRRP
jgi:hypothetical protein